MEIYPNPSSNLVTIKLESEETILVKIFNNLGELVLTSEKSSFSVSSLAKGNYIVLIETDRNQYSSRFVKQ